MSLAPPSPARANRADGERLGETVSLQMFLNEDESSPVITGAFDLFARLVQWNFRTGAKPDGGWLEGSRQTWCGLYDRHDALRSACAPCFDGHAIEAFSRADALAQRYAGLYRSTFVINFFLSAVAVGAALVGSALGATLGDRYPSWPTLCVEFSVLCVIIYLTYEANRRKWHERWIEYRHLAEQLRPFRFLFPLGLVAPKARVGHPIAGREQASEWTDWLTRRVERSLGVPDAIVDAAYLEAVRSFALEAVLDEQIAYHRDNAEKLHKVDHRLHIAGSCLFIATAAVCALDLAWVLVEMRGHAHVGATDLARRIEALRPWLLVVSGVFPALGAAILGVRNVGEFARLTRRSLAMQAALERFRDELGTPPHRHGRKDDLRSQLEAIAVQMMSETADWRTLVIDRRIEWPG